MKRNQLWLIPVVLSVLVLTSCSGLPQGSGTGGGGGGNNTTSAATFTMISQSQSRPGNFTILAWNATLDSLSLNESGGNATNINLGSIPVDFNRLSTDSVLLGSFTNIPVNTRFTTMTLALSHFIITIHNESGANIGNCSDQAICEFSPAPATVNIASTLAVEAGKTVNVFFTVFPSVILSVSTSGLSVNFTTNTPISEQSILRTGLPANAIDTLEDFTGKVTAISGNTITISGATGTQIIATIGSATFDDDSPSPGCTPPKSIAGCVKVGSIVSLDGDINLNGSVTATEIDLLDPSPVDAIEGTIFPTGGGFGLVVTDKQVMSSNATLTAASIGDIFTVNGLTSATYSVDTKTLSTVTAPPIPTNLFQSSAGLLGGQTVRLHVTAATGSAGTNNQTVTTDAVQLRWTRVTATPNLPSGSVIDITGVGSVFQLPTQGSAMVQTYSPGTTLDNVGSLGQLGPGGFDLISTRALFLNGVPNFFAAKVRAQ